MGRRLHLSSLAAADPVSTFTPRRQLLTWLKSQQEWLRPSPGRPPRLPTWPSRLPPWQWPPGSSAPPPPSRSQRLLSARSLPSWRSPCCQPGGDWPCPLHRRRYCPCLWSEEHPG